MFESIMPNVMGVLLPFVPCLIIAMLHPIRKQGLVIAKIIFVVLGVVQGLEAVAGLWWSDLPWYISGLIFTWPLWAYVAYQPRILLGLYRYLHLRYIKLTEFEKAEAARGAKDGSIFGVIPTPAKAWRARYIYLSHYVQAMQRGQVDPFVEEGFDVVFVVVG